MTENSELVGFQLHYICGHKSPTNTKPKVDSTVLFNILGAQSYCVVCTELQKVVRIILFDVDSNKWL